MTSPQVVQQMLQNEYVHFYNWVDEKDKVWWIASLGYDKPAAITGTRQPTIELALSALIREMTKDG